MKKNLVGVAAAGTLVALFVAIYNGWFIMSLICVTFQVSLLIAKRMNDNELRYRSLRRVNSAYRDLLSLPMNTAYDERRRHIGVFMDEVSNHLARWPDEKRCGFERCRYLFCEMVNDW
ncbi:hypothetical protein KGQ27_00555 [Patescibacteria group bacterium]|nr:hypothetical protein [Patescibacteria group bacterium]MDE1946837.1 hypothetical protein [Patescibacteria group bacterium]MDE2010657.1 hypothetical protein [Patescibacteria group bacterium]MDE2232737.1 hypothetical protein [Patescibacteria group bacterium]